MLNILLFHCLHNGLVALLFSWKGGETNCGLNLGFLCWLQSASFGDWQTCCASPIGGASKLTFKASLTLEEVQKENPQVAKGRYHPTECSALQHVAILIPHRNREKHLLYLLEHLHPFLQRQQLDYGIYVIHQVRQLCRDVFGWGWQQCSAVWGQACCCLCCLTSVLQACFKHFYLLRDAMVHAAITGSITRSQLLLAKLGTINKVSLTGVHFSVLSNLLFLS